MNVNTSPVYVVGVGMHPYQAPSTTPYVDLGLTAIRRALEDAGIAWGDVDSAFVGTALVGVASGRPMLRHLGATGLSITHVENASASGSTAVHSAVLAIASGSADVVLSVGVDKPTARPDGFMAGALPSLADDLIAPVTNFALFAAAYLDRFGLGPEVLANVAVKNSRNASRNPNAQRREPLTAAEVLAATPISGVLTKHMCCPVGEGAAAVILASEAALSRLGLDRSRAVRVAASVSRSEQVYDDDSMADQELTRATTRLALDQAGIGPTDLDVVEVHDAFAIEELAYIEAIGLAEPGMAGAGIRAGAFDIGGDCAVSASGGLLSMGHPIGPTGVGQIAEITAQLRGESGPRQHRGARIGLAHMLGLGSVCVEHVLMSE